MGKAADNFVRNLDRLLEFERRKKGDRITQESVAAAAGVDQSYISDLKRGRRRNPSLKVLEAIAEGLGIELIDLLTKPGSPPEVTIERLFPDPAHARLHRLLQAILDAGTPETATVESILQMAAERIATQSAANKPSVESAIQSIYRSLKKGSTSKDGRSRRPLAEAMLT